MQSTFLEVTFDMDKFMEKVKYLSETKSSVVIAVSEGIALADGRFLYASWAMLPISWMLSDTSSFPAGGYLANKVAAETGLKTRAVEFSTLQRAATHLLPDRYQRSIPGRTYDAVMAAEEGKTGMMITLDRNGDDPYQCGTSAYDIHAIANVERPVPAEWITEDGCDVNDGYVKYARPLIMGELQTAVCKRRAASSCKKIKNSRPA